MAGRLFRLALWVRRVGTTRTGTGQFPIRCELTLLSMRLRVEQNNENEHVKIIRYLSVASLVSRRLRPVTVPKARDDSWPAEIGFSAKTGSRASEAWSSGGEWRRLHCISNQRSAPLLVQGQLRVNQMTEACSLAFPSILFCTH